MADVVFLASGEKDAKEAYQHCFELDPVLAERFSRAIDLVVRELGRFPESGVQVGGRFRRKLVPWFRNYGVFYVFEGLRVVIQAVQDLRQDPEMIQRRLSK